MSITIWISLAVVLVAVFAMKRMSLVSADNARRFMQEGALVVDVRNRSEFNSGHLAGAINLPLADLSSEASRLLRDKSQYLLLHCLSGARSGIAKSQLQKLGYQHAFNLGSYRRAEQIMNVAGKVRTTKSTEQGT